MVTIPSSKSNRMGCGLLRGISFMVLGEHLDQLILIGAASPAFLELPPSRKTGVGVSPQSSDPGLFLYHLPPTKPVLLNLGFPLASPGGLFKKRPLDFPGGSVVKNLPASAGGMGSIPGLGGSHMA